MVQNFSEPNGRMRERKERGKRVHEPEKIVEDLLLIEQTSFK